jgi:ribosome biogenesis GTPase
VLPPGSREKSEQARSRFDRPAGAGNLVTGDIVAFRGLFADVRLAGASTEDETVRCAVRGRLETADSEDRALFAVGDRVEFSCSGRPRPPDTAPAGPGEGVIERLLPRRNSIVRGDRRVQRFRHVIAANVDGVVLVTSALEPRFRPGIVDRFLVAASSQNVAASLVVNKTDLLDGENAKRTAEIDEYRALYESIGVTVFLTSAARAEGLEPLVEHLATGRLVLAGHSGVGKSTLLNALRPGLDLTVRPVNRKTGKGTHTTAVARLVRLPGGIEVIDTPGVRELDIVEVASVNLEAHFPEFLPLLDRCEMDNCAHRTEPGCSVRAAAEAGEIHPRRYQSYLTIREAIEKQERAYA